MSRLNGKMCVVNGVASPIGHAVAERFAGEGGVVVGVDKVAHNIGDLVLPSAAATGCSVKKGLPMRLQVGGDAMTGVLRPAVARGLNR
jgi:NAD(P)-dependent dehydrogenase (short-subunit alcohol dehydrogenase family)